MLTREENELLCQVGAGTPMGTMLRRYWIPAALTGELEAGGAPRRTRLLGEDLVAFRAADGTVGVLEEHCPHRGASLALARNVDCTLQCIYHGWKVAPDGRVLDTPAEPEGSNFAAKVRARSFPVYEAGGIVWTYLGPPENEPPQMHFDWMSRPAEHRMIQKVYEECNWVQSLEGVIDTAHSNFLHSNLIKPVAGLDVTTMAPGQGETRRPSDDTSPRIEAETTPYGFRYAAIRHPLIDPELRDYVRVTLFIAPFYSFFPGPMGWTYMQAFVPIDDEHTMFHFVQVQHDAPVDAAARKRREERAAMRPGIDLDSEYHKSRRRANNWLQDRAAMLAGNFTGIEGVNNEDIAVQESMGAIYDRTKEHLGASDTAVIRMRRIMLDGVRHFMDGAPPVGLAEPVAYETLHAEERMVPKGESWQAFALA
ncbi:MAG: Rieske 2Fe-2S domain-containing protein [Candidatus Lustribacter sp.]|jgi:phthalate 4,5-dioxygenase oxygenase subunit